MAATKQIPRDQLFKYFDTFTKRFLRNDSPERVDVEVLTSDLGDQRVVEGVALIGITYDPHTNALEFERESGDHRAFHPREVWVSEEAGGFVTAVEVVRDDGLREVMRVQRLGVDRQIPAATTRATETRAPR
jgi:hypothetical protein